MGITIRVILYTSDVSACCYTLSFKINNTIITESGIIAAAHLAGPGNVKKYLRSSGKHNPKDAFGTSISLYMDYFKGYDITMVESIRKPKI